MKRLIPFCMLFFLYSVVGISQNASIEHTVSAGETLFQIAKRYNVTTSEIQQANGGIIVSQDIIRIGDVLTIPQSGRDNSPRSTSTNSSGSTVSASPGQTITYTVKKGETKFGLAKRFGVSIPELESQNPQIIPQLNEGHVLTVKVNKYLADETPKTNTTSPTVEGYKNHLVLKGETLWGISHSNGLTVDQLVEANSEVLSGVLKEGQTLRVPLIKDDGLSSETYLVKYGDTKYSLAKKYETTIERLESLNPHIIRMLQAGHTIRIPSTALANDSFVKETANTSENTTQTDITSNNEESVSDTTEITDTQTADESIENSPISETVSTSQVVQNNEVASDSIQTTNTPIVETIENDGYVLYEVKSKETLYGLAKKASMSIDEFVTLNPQLKESVQVGTIIKMPKTAISLDETFEIKDNPDASAPATTTPSYVDLSKTSITAERKNVLFFFPFNESQFNEELRNKRKLNTNSNDFDTKHLEFYTGAKIALDSVQKLGLQIDASILEIENNLRTANLSDLNADVNLKEFDAFILPFYNAIEEEFASMVAPQKTPVISAETIAHKNNLSNLYEAFPSINKQRKKVLDYMVSKQANIIVINDANRTESKDFIVENVPSAQLIELKKNGSFSEEDLISKFKKNRLNYVVLESERNSVFLNVTNILLSELSSYDLQLAVLESELIPDDDDVSVKRFRILKMIFPSLTPVVSNIKSENFSKVYEKTYNFPPSNNSILGFDITFDTLLRLLQQKGFETSVQNDVTEYVKLKFDYKTNAYGGYSNDGVYILQYDTKSNLQEAQ